MIDKSKSYRTRDGREVRIYATDGEHGQTIHGAIKHEEDGWQFRIWYRNGKYDKNEEHRYDLIEVRPRHKRVVWLNVYPSGHGCHYDNVTDANCNAGIGRIACLRVELDFSEGDGL